MLNNKLIALTIESYSDKQRQTKLQSYEVMFNPTSLSLRYENQFARQQGINTSSVESSYQYTRPRSLNLELVVDVAIESKTKGINSVKQKIEDIIKLLVMNGDTHQPPFLKLHWGQMQWGIGGSGTTFDCRIDSVNVTYTLFARDGTPLKAKLDTAFIEDIRDQKRVRLERKNSPDLTHTKIVSAGDRLPLLSQEIYQNPLFYLKIAQHNKLDNFRGIANGITLYFPPVVTDNVS